MTQRIGNKLLRGLNKAMAVLLRSPLHGLLSGSTLVLTFRGRKTGKVYSTPLSYRRDGDVVNVFTDAAWSRNMRGGAEVTLLLKGKTFKGHAELIEDQQMIAEALDPFFRRVRRDAPLYGVSFDRQGNPNHAQVVAAARDCVLVKITLQV